MTTYLPTSHLPHLHLHHNHQHPTHTTSAAHKFRPPLAATQSAHPSGRIPGRSSHAHLPPARASAPASPSRQGTRIARTLAAFMAVVHTHTPPWYEGKIYFAHPIPSRESRVELGWACSSLLQEGRQSGGDRGLERTKYRSIGPSGTQAEEGRENRLNSPLPPPGDVPTSPRKHRKSTRLPSRPSIPSTHRRIHDREILDSPSTTGVGGEDTNRLESARAKTALRLSRPPSRRR